MSLYNVVLAKPARKELAKLPKAAQKIVVEALESLREAPRQTGTEKLQSNPTFLRLRCGDYRIIYTIRDNQKLCVVVVIRDRKDAFKGLDALDAKLARALSMVADKLLEKAAIVGAA